ncbi:hypothetical protein Cgig2_007833 [Carnegiea gigantea]|uniref:Oligopeptidase A N-terminal domain-containing protein n=1 Tax=Carnegiea gigantea TaxID=171969 RepID=A0A9Q1GTG1_9CARY|nr:hypothetical protein Cgig2_007833 [Carnegiea gigantea]
MAASNENPLLWDFTFPPYDVIQPKHVVPGVRSLLKQLLLVPLERITDRLRVVWGVVNHLISVKDSLELRAAVDQIQVEFELRLGQSKTIYEAFKAIRESSDWETLSSSRKRVVKAQLKSAKLGGVSLNDDEKERFNETHQELERLALKFEGNILDATKDHGKLITDRKDVEGLPSTTLELAAKAAISKALHIKIF